MPQTAVVRQYYSMSEYLLTTEGLTKQYGMHKAVNSISMHIPSHSIYGFIGKNGAGKTTTLKMLAGLSSPSSGKIEMFGKTGSELNAFRKHIGCAIESPGIYPNLTAYDNIKAKCLVSGVFTKKHCNDLLELVGLENTGKKTAGKFSLGMKQRLGIALALVGNPDLVMLDEPINGLDPQGISDVRNMLTRLNVEKGITIIISSHILEELSKVATNYGIIDNGSLILECDNEYLSHVCSERVELVTPNVSEALPVLDSMGITQYSVIGNNTISIPGYTNDTVRINRSLVEAGIPVVQLIIKSENLESFFLSLTGGVHHD